MEKNRHFPSGIRPPPSHTSFPFSIFLSLPQKASTMPFVWWVSLNFVENVVNVNRGRSRGKCFGGNLSDAGIKRLIYVSGSERREINISQNLDSWFGLGLGAFCFVWGPSWLATILSICICSSTFFEAGLLSNWIGFSKKLHLGERRGLICCAPSVPDLFIFIMVVSFIIMWVIWLKIEYGHWRYWR